MYREMGMTYWLEKAEADMKQLRWNSRAAGLRTCWASHSSACRPDRVHRTRL